MKAFLVAAAALALGSASMAAAQEAPPPAPPTPSPSAPPPSPGPTKTSAGADGFVIESADGDFRLRARGYVQFDGRFYPGSDAPNAGTSTFLMRRVRPILQGRVGRHFELELMPDFGGGSAGIEDAYLEVRMSSSFRIRVGKYKTPVGLERLQSSTNLAFVERALPTGLVPNRDVGAMIHGELGSGVVTYAAGVFNGARDGGSLDGDTNDGKDVTARVFVSPFKRGASPLRDLALGIAGTTGTQEGAVPAYRSGGQVALFTYARDVVADGTRTRVVPQLSFYRGPFGLMAEYARSRAAMRPSRLEKTGTNLTVEAWQATAAWVLTGEPKSYTAVRPGRPFDPAAGQWGALELVARVNGFMADDLAFKGGFADPEASARKALAWGLGINWYLTRHVRQCASFERTSFTGGAPGGSDRPAENALFIRTQVAF